MLKRHLDNLLTKIIDWWFRVATIERYLIGSGLALLLGVYGSAAAIIIFLRLVLGVAPEGLVKETIETLDVVILGFALLLIGTGVALAVVRFFGEARMRSKKRNVVIEARGLRDDDGKALADTIRNAHEGAVISVLLNLRNKLDGEIIKPDKAVDEIMVMHRHLNQTCEDGDRNDLKTFYGGLAPVPYTFLTGVLLDDEGAIITYDWDRVQETWRKVDDNDDGRSFIVEGLDAIWDVAEVVVALAFSYPVNDDDLNTTFTLPEVTLTLDGMSSDGHWSQQKQNRLAQEFFEVAKQLSGRGVQRIHLVLAAPNSVVFTFGRRYDKRNLPGIVVYQYQRGKKPAYPWGILMPVAGVERAKVFHSLGSAKGSD
ncbi:SAVED domain-containing protein [Sulfitobacter sp.]|jgi:hypothetical protein|uniref:SAVED domain-containing protein n=1 Tax=Sulfitobacter sp. TaxID=1903071 RepID=UPI0039E56345